MLAHPTLCPRKATGLAYFFSFVLLLITFSLSAQDRPAYFDGPYIFQEGDNLRIKWVERGYPHDTLIAKMDATVFERDSLPVVDLQSLDFPTAPSSTYTEVERIVVTSDVHGQYHLMQELLLAGGVIDSLDNWALGKGHLVVIGDNMDRGDQVLPILWLLFKLEQQALAAGGRLHLLLGNHELMVLNGDLRYLNRKYTFTAGVLQTPYNQLFAEGSVLGDWIAQHQVVVSVNERLFLHAGISPEVLALELSLDEINTAFREGILRQPEDAIYANPTLVLLADVDGPLWYRGYFGDKPLKRGKFKRQLKQYAQQGMVVGHTSQENIQARYKGQLIVVDCSIKLGLSGQILLIEGDEVYLIDEEGEQFPVAGYRKVPTTSIQEGLMASTTRPKLTLQTNFPRVIRTKLDEEYQEAIVTITADDIEHTLTGRVRARGNMRKQVCHIPPLMIDLRKSELDSIEYIRHDKLKLVIPCQRRTFSQRNLYKEFLVYELYHQISDHGIRTKLVDVEIIEPKRQYEFTGFLIETDQDYAHRTGALVLKEGRASASAVDRQRFVRAMFFQYMIANCDWSIHNKHNLQLVKYPDNMRTEFIPYDFDYSGFVGNPYAVPADVLPIKSVHERYFFSYKTTDEEINDAMAYFLEKEQVFYATIDAAEYLEEETREECKEYLQPFFELLREPRKFKRAIRRKS